jgi:hypothetical protein
MEILDPVGLGVSVLMVVTCVIGVVAIGLAVRRDRRGRH